MASYKELVAQKDALDARIAAARKGELDHAVRTIRELVNEFGLTQEDLFSARRVRPSNANRGRTVAAKYRDPETGATWTGRGKAPRWIANEDRDRFAL